MTGSILIDIFQMYLFMNICGLANLEGPSHRQKTNQFHSNIVRSIKDIKRYSKLNDWVSIKSLLCLLLRKEVLLFKISKKLVRNSKVPVVRDRVRDRPVITDVHPEL